MLEIRDLRKKYGNFQALDGLNTLIFRVMPVLLYHECFQYIDKVETIP